jgi:hypothetical protein
MDAINPANIKVCQFYRVAGDVLRKIERLERLNQKDRRVLAKDPENNLTASDLGPVLYIVLPSKYEPLNRKNVLQFLNFSHYAEEDDRFRSYQLQSHEFSDFPRIELQGGFSLQGCVSHYAEEDSTIDLQSGEDYRIVLHAASSGACPGLAQSLEAGLRVLQGTIHEITRATTATVNSLGLCANDPANLRTYLCTCVVLSGMIAAAAAIRKFRV